MKLRKIFLESFKKMKIYWCNKNKKEAIKQMILYKNKV
jgi:hypothetical protein